METNELMFDDWAMFLVEQWKEADLANDKRECFYELLFYLCQILQYDVPRHRYGYANYSTIRFEPNQYEFLLRLSDYAALHGRLPHDRDYAEDAAVLQTDIVKMKYVLTLSVLYSKKQR